MTRHSIENDDNQAQDQPQHCDSPDQAPDLFLQTGFFDIDRLECLSNLTHLGLDARGPDPGNALPLNHHRSREDEGKVFAAGASHSLNSVPDHFSDGDGFAGQQRLIGGQVIRLDHDRIGGNSITLGQNDQVIRDDVPARDTDSLSITDHERARAGKITQGFQRPLGLPFLVKRDSQNNENEPEKHQRFLDIAENEIDRAAGQQQHKHRFPNHLPGGREETAVLRCRKFVVAVFSQANTDVVIGEAEWPGMLAGHSKFLHAHHSSILNRLISGGITGRE